MKPGETVKRSVNLNQLYDMGSEATRANLRAMGIAVAGQEATV